MKNVFSLEPGRTYRIYGETIGDEIAFKSERNYLYFLERFCDFVLPIADTYSYCLLPDRYCFLIRICEKKTIDAVFPKRRKLKTPYSDLISRQIGNFLLSYTQSINKERNRRGGLFMKQFRRELILDEIHLVKTMRHIHCLPVTEGLCDSPDKWRYSSYPLITNYCGTFVCSDKLIAQFGSMEKFIDFHFGDTNDSLDKAA